MFRCRVHHIECTLYAPCLALPRLTRSLLTLNSAYFYCLLFVCLVCGDVLEGGGVAPLLPLLRFVCLYFCALFVCFLFNGCSQCIFVFYLSQFSLDCGVSDCLFIFKRAFFSLDLIRFLGTTLFSSSTILLGGGFTQIGYRRRFRRLLRVLLGRRQR